MRRTALLGLIVLQACVSHGVQPLKPHDLATAPYQGIVSHSLTGSLFYQGDCLLFRDDGRTVQLLPVWPVGSAFNGTAVTFQEPGRSTQPIVMGEEFVMEGRQLDWAAMSHPAYAQFERQCGAQPFLVSHVRPAN
jgi:hypothetical protein